MPTAGEQLADGMEALGLVNGLKVQHPCHWYTPHTQGQEQFHASKHTIRCLFPGNGWGKTTAAGCEVAYWVEHYHPYQPESMPKWPVQILWFAQEFRQWELLRPQIEAECLPAGWNWNDQKHRYEWGDGSMVWVISCDRDWTYIQGINPDLCVFDEQPPLKLWREMQMRRRGRRKTRYIFAATATEGESWMEKELWQPWQDAHKAVGIDKAREQQLHEHIWIWDRGGIDSNPGADETDRKWYHQTTWSSDEEKRVRLHGGFGRFNGRPVFSLEALSAMEARMDEWDKVRGVGRTGSFCLRDAQGNAANAVLGLSPEQIKGKRFTFCEAPTEGGRVELWEAPIAGGTYVIGGDGAKGMEQGDFDSFPIYILPGERDKIGPKKRQVGLMHGHWGERMDRLLYAAAMYYNGAFICLERQEGLATMRRLWDDYGYKYIYYQRDPAQPNRKVRDALGHARIQDDFTIRNLQIALINGDIEIRDRMTVDQMRRLEWFKPGEEPGVKDRPRDADLRMRLPGGGSPDATMGTAYAWLALREVFHYDKPEDLFPKGSLGDIFGYEKVFAPKSNGVTVGNVVIGRTR